jgi:hypothetical protein
LFGIELKVMSVIEQFEFSQNVVPCALETQVDTLFDLWQKAETKINDLENRYLTTCYMKDQPASVILVNLWRQAPLGSELQSRFEEMLIHCPGVQKIEFAEDYSFIAIE